MRGADRLRVGKRSVRSSPRRRTTGKSTLVLASASECPMRLAVRICLVVAPAALAVALAGGAALAQNPDEAPAPCRAQAKNALEQIAPAFAGKAARKIAAKAPG